MELRIGSAEFDAQGTPDVRLGFCEFDALASIGVNVGFCEFDCFAPPIIDDSLKPGGGYGATKGKRANKTLLAPALSVKQEVAALAAALTKSAKLTRTAKKKRREEVIAEVIQRLDDVPNVEEVAPIIAQAVVRREAQIAALPPSQVTAGEQRNEIAGVIEQQIAKWRAKQKYDAHVDDESEIEMLLLG